MRRETTFNEIFDSQQYYRLLMDSMAHPGKINKLYLLEVEPPHGLNKATALVAFSLLNADSSFCSINENEGAITNYILLNTSASPVEETHADFVFISGHDRGASILAMKTGTLPYPEEGATVVIDVKTISHDATKESVAITVSGPGVKTKETFFVKGLNEDVMKNFVSMNSEFPLGIDAILTDEENNIVCIPRSNKVLWKINH